MKKAWRFWVVLLINVSMLMGCVRTGIPEVPSTETATTDVGSDTESESGSQTETGEEVTDTGTTEDTEPDTEEVVPEPVVETITITATGDCALGALQYHGYSKSFHQFYDKYGESYFFEKFYDIFSQDDLTIVNLECVFTDESDRVDKKFNIKGHPHYTGILTSSSVEVCSLANNHTEDYGPASFEDTKSALDAAALAYAYEDVVAYYTTEAGVKVALKWLCCLQSCYQIKTRRNRF